MKRSVIFMIIVLLLAACAPAANQTAATPGGKTESGGSQAESDQLLIFYKSSGGLAGKTNEISIYADGRIVTSKAGEQKVDPALVAQLLADIKTAGFFEMKDSYGGIGQCNDCIKYELSVSDGAKMKTIATFDSAKDTPAEFWQVVEKIDQLLAK